MLLDVNSNKNIVSEENLKNLKRRKLVQMITRKSYRITKGESYQPTRVKRMADLTKEMLGNLDEVSINLIYYYYLYLSFSLSYPVLFLNDVLFIDAIWSTLESTCIQIS